MLADTLRELLAELRTQRARTLLSLLGMVWGTLALVLLLAFSFGFEELFAERARGLGEGVAIAWPQRTTRAHAGLPVGRPLVVRRDDVLALGRSCRGLAGISAEFSVQERVRIGGNVLRIPISGVEPVFAQLRSLAARPDGRFPNERDTQERARVVFLGDVLARTLFAQQDPIGRTLSLRGVPFTVVGVLQPKLQDSDYGGQDKDRAFVPAATFVRVFGERPVSNFVFAATAPSRQQEVTAELTRALAQRLRFHPEDRAALSVWDTTEQGRMMFFIFLGFHTMLGIGGIFTLLVGGLGVGWLMFVLVRRRTAEIGLKLAVGASPARIRREWLVQAAVLVGIGAGTGLGLSALAIALVRGSPLVTQVGRPFVPPLLALVTTAVLAAVALAAGLLPARAASRLDPVAALRGQP